MEDEYLQLEEDIFCSLANGFDSSAVDAVTGKGKRRFHRQQYELTAGRRIEVLPEKQDTKLQAFKKQAVKLSETYQELYKATPSGLLVPTYCWQKPTKKNLQQRWKKRQSSVRYCADYVEMHDGYITDTLFCGVRLCPICQYRRSLKIANQVRQVIQTMIERQSDTRFLLLTLTYPNCYGYCLKPTIKRFLHGFRKLSHYNEHMRYDADYAEEFNKMVLGWYRTVEVTYNGNINSPSFDTYHPHIHTILAVNGKDYFGDGHNQRLYKNHDWWLNAWRWAMGDTGYHPVDSSGNFILDKLTGEPITKYQIGQVDIRPITPNYKKAEKYGFEPTDTAAALMCSVLETAKYAAKSNQYIDSPANVQTLDLALERHRLVEFGGCMRDIQKELKLDDVNSPDVDLLNVGDMPVLALEDVKKCFAFCYGLNRYIRVDNLHPDIY